jgi:Zn finger protein HypA/HybF involved in hydrogenase expression
MSKEPKKNNVSERPSLLGMKCLDCREEILQRDPQKCPYCGSTHLISKKDDISNAIAEIEKLKKAGRYEDAALRYEELEMWDKADETRNMNTGKVSAIKMDCPHCGASQQLSLKINEVICKHCGKKYGVPKKVLELF